MKNTMELDPITATVRVKRINYIEWCKINVE